MWNDVHSLFRNSHHFLSAEKGREPLISAKQVERMSHQCRHRCIFHAASQIWTIKFSDTEVHVWQVTRHLCFPPVSFFLEDVLGCSCLQFTALCFEHTSFLSRYCNISQYKKSKSEAVINMNSEGTFLYFTRTLAHLFISCDLWIREFYPFLCKKRQFLCCKRNVILEVFDYVTAVTKADKREMPTFIGFSFVIEML